MYHNFQTAFSQYGKMKHLLSPKKYFVKLYLYLVSSLEKRCFHEIFAIKSVGVNFHNVCFVITI